MEAWAGLLAALQAADQEGSALWVGRRPSVLASPAAVVGAYAWGSRVYGTARPTSDWDVVCITSTSTTSSTPDPSSPTPPPREPGGDAAAAGGVEGPYALYDDGHYNASFYSLPQWITAVRWLLPRASWAWTCAHHRRVWCVVVGRRCGSIGTTPWNAHSSLLSMYARVHSSHSWLLALALSLMMSHDTHDTQRWREDKEAMKRAAVVVDPDVLYRRVSWEARRRINIAKDKQAKSGEDPRKDIVHSLRYLLFALQILHTVPSPGPCTRADWGKRCCHVILLTWRGVARCAGYDRGLRGGQRAL